jgi:hypothetical protein
MHAAKSYHWIYIQVKQQPSALSGQVYMVVLALWTKFSLMDQRSFFVHGQLPGVSSFASWLNNWFYNLSSILRNIGKRIKFMMEWHARRLTGFHQVYCALFRHAVIGGCK